MPTPIIPQFTLRRLLVIMTLAALVFAVVALGVHGSHWAAAVSIGGLALVVLLAVHALFFTIVWLFSLAWRPRRRAGDSPFQKVPR